MCDSQNLCVNEEVKKLQSINRINDRCLELQKNKKKGLDLRPGGLKLG